MATNLKFLSAIDNIQSPMATKMTKFPGQFFKTLLFQTGRMLGNQRKSEAIATNPLIPS